MIKESRMQPEYVWGAVSILLLLAEAVTLTSVGLVFGLSAGVLFSLLIIFHWPESVALQVMIFAAIGLALYFPIRKIQYMTSHKQTTGDIAAAIQAAPMGSVIHVDDVGAAGEVRLDHAFLSARVLPFMCDVPVHLNDRVRIVEVNGNILKIEQKGD